MNDKEYAAAMLRIRKAVGKWHDALGLGWWRVTYEYEREEIAPLSGESLAPGTKLGGDCLAMWRYKEATIRLNVPVLARLSDDELERTTLHEQLHILVNELREDGIDHEERVVSELTAAFKWVEEGKFGKPIARSH